MDTSSWLVMGGATVTLGGMTLGLLIDPAVMRVCLAFGVPMLALGACLADDPE